MLGTDAGAVRILHHPPEQRDRRALILNSLCFGGALPPFKLSLELRRGQCLFDRIKALCGADEVMTGAGVKISEARMRADKVMGPNVNENEHGFTRAIGSDV
jgi:hypothetical protein